jgi:uncharacterized protein (AIM24 family)
MASINASTSGAGGVITTADNTGNLNIQSAGSTVLALTSSGTTVTGTGSFSGNLSFNSGYGSAAVAYGCRAWVNFNGTGTVAIRGSGNVSSITDNGTGNYTVNITTAMPDINYSIQISKQNIANNNDFAVYDLIINRTTTSANIQMFELATLQDSNNVNVAIFR